MPDAASTAEHRLGRAVSSSLASSVERSGTSLPAGANLGTMLKKRVARRLLRRTAGRSGSLLLPAQILAMTLFLKNLSMAFMSSY